MKSLQDLFVHMLKDVYHAEKQAIRAYPKMVKSVKTPELKQALEEHRDETLGQVERLEQIFEMLDRRARGEPCEAMQSLIEEGREVLEEAEDDNVREAGIIAAAQAIEHYEIARYGTLRAWAEELGMGDAAKLLQQTLDEEKKTDERLNKLAVDRVNRKAA
ncbi:YciE/YciF ferroxidase family protein [Salinarimonas soli]|uniref:Ferritin-like domain-containing protein n=1 Tax=Salinarimonas soli TaxID=1638099 RepID=A0A5B2VFY3_9HYPH|nr:ferritin-like domain-containing protein [Salinarimonas soli]KAA2237219.1 ferritin-like domain-containing protein [Salinarimonas soli]